MTSNEPAADLSCLRFQQRRCAQRRESKGRKRRRMVKRPQDVKARRVQEAGEERTVAHTSSGR
jgi:hypothetical protein